MKFILILCFLFSFNVLSESTDQRDYRKLFPDMTDTITCRLSSIARVTYEKGKIKKEAKSEAAKSTSVFTGLTTDKPKMLKPDKIDLIKIKEHNGIYWLISPLGTTGLVFFTIDTGRKIMIQQRSADMLGLVLYGHSWMGRCE